MQVRRRYIESELLLAKSVYFICLLKFFLDAEFSTSKSNFAERLGIQPHLLGRVDTLLYTTTITSFLIYPTQFNTQNPIFLRMHREVPSTALPQNLSPTTSHHDHTPKPSQQTNIATMVGADKKTAMHIIEILGLVVCAHHFWPKGITYGEQEEWEKAYRKRHGHGSKASKKVREEAHRARGERVEYEQGRGERVEYERERSGRREIEGGRYGDGGREVVRADRYGNHGGDRYEERSGRMDERYREERPRPRSGYYEERAVDDRRMSARY